MRSNSVLSNLKNRNLNDKSRVAKNNKPNNKTEIEINLTAQQQMFLKGYFKQELHFYNAILHPLLCRYNRNPISLTLFDDGFKKLFGELCFNAFDINDLKHKTLPKSLENFKNKKFSEADRIFSESAKTPADIIQDTRKRIGETLLEYFISQSLVKNQNEIINSFGEVEYKVNPESIEIPDIMQKRHLQILKKFVKFTYDIEKDITTLWIPYLTNPILLNKINLFNIGNWNTLIIHQETGIIPIDVSPWFLTFKYSKNEEYLIKFRDKGNKHSIFSMAQRG